MEHKRENNMPQGEAVSDLPSFRHLFEQANALIFLNEWTNKPKWGAYLKVNRAACRQLLYSKEEFRQLNPYAIIPAAQHETLHRHLKQLQAKKKLVFELEFLRKDKRRIPVEISAVLLENKGRPAVLSVVRDITRYKQTQAKLQEATARLRDLAGRIQQIREEERAMLSREIHDELGQVLTVLKIQLSLTRKKLLPQQNEQKEKLDYACTLIDRTVESVQQISAKLRPGILDELGLIPAIEWQANEFEKRIGIPCRLSLADNPPDLPAEKTTALFRIFQEALTNVARHSRANRVSVFLKFQPDMLILEITDNGRGITKTQISDPTSLGILSMRERVLVFGGQLHINGVPDKGTHIKVTMPLS